MELNVEIIGMNRLRARLSRAEKRLDPKTAEALDQVADRIVMDAKALCPVDTGSLRRSIRKQKHAMPAGHVHSVSVSAGGYVTNPKTGRKVDYAAYVEYGTSKTVAQPFLSPAIQQNRMFLRQVLSRGLREALS